MGSLIEWSHIPVHFYKRYWSSYFKHCTPINFQTEGYVCLTPIALIYVTVPRKTTLIAQN